MGAVRGYLNKFKTPLQRCPAWNVHHSKAVQVSPPLGRAIPDHFLTCIPHQADSSAANGESSTGLFSITLRWIPMVPRSEDFCHEEIIYRKSLPQVRVRVNGRYCSQILWRVHHDNINVLKSDNQLLSSTVASPHISSTSQVRVQHFTQLNGWPCSQYRWGFMLA